MKKRYLAYKDKQTDASKDIESCNWTITRKINRSRALISNYINLGEAYGKEHTEDRNKKLTKRQHSLLMRSVAKEVKSAAQLRTEFELPVTTRRVQQILKSFERFQSIEILQKAALRKQQKQVHLEFGHMFWTKEREYVIFSDKQNLI